MKKYLLLLIIFLLASTSVKANGSYNTYLTKMATCAPYKYTTTVLFGLKVEQQILGPKNGYCYLRDIQYTYNLPKGVDFPSLTDEELKEYLVPASASVYALTKEQLIEYRNSLIKQKTKAKNQTSITVSTKNMRSIKAVKNYEYKDGKWVKVNMDSYLMY